MLFLQLKMNFPYTCGVCKALRRQQHKHTGIKWTLRLPLNFLSSPNIICIFPMGTQSQKVLHREQFDYASLFHPERTRKKTATKIPSISVQGKHWRTARSAVVNWHYFGSLREKKIEIRIFFEFYFHFTLVLYEWYLSIIRAHLTHEITGQIFKCIF